MRGKIFRISLAVFILLVCPAFLLQNPSKPQELNKTIILPNIYVTVAADCDVTELTMFTQFGASLPHSNTTRLIEQDGKKYFHFAVSYQPDTIYTLGGNNVIDYVICNLDGQTEQLNLYLNQSGEISFKGKVAFS